MLTYFDVFWPRVWCYDRRNFAEEVRMDSGCDVYVYADNSSVVCAENAVFIPRMRLWGDFGVF